LLPYNLRTTFDVVITYDIVGPTLYVTSHVRRRRRDVAYVVGLTFDVVGQDVRRRMWQESRCNGGHWRRHHWHAMMTQAPPAVTVAARGQRPAAVRLPGRRSSAGPAGPPGQTVTGALPRDWPQGINFNGAVKSVGEAPLAAEAARGLVSGFAAAAWPRLPRSPGTRDHRTIRNARNRRSGPLTVRVRVTGLH
jgi:hypothetical protein